MFESRQPLNKTFLEAEVLPTLRLSALKCSVSATFPGTGLAQISQVLCRWVKDAKSAASLNVMSVKKVTRGYTGMLCLICLKLLNSVGLNKPSLAVSADCLLSADQHACDAAEDDRKFVSLIGFDCRGMDVINWHPEVLLTVVCAVYVQRLMQPLIIFCAFLLLLQGLLRSVLLRSTSVIAMIVQYMSAGRCQNTVHCHRMAFR